MIKLRVTLFKIFMTIDNDAEGQFRGYLFQIERTLYWLCDLESGGKVGVETGDDVVAQKADGITVSEQDKSSITTKSPYTNKSKDLWKTLRIWLNKLGDNPKEAEKYYFILATNKKVPSSRFVWELHKALSDEECEACLKSLKKLATSTSKDLQAIMNDVIGFDDAVIKALIKRIRLSSGQLDKGGGLKTSIRNSLKVHPDLPFDNMYISLLGWVCEQVMDAWDKNEEAWLDVDSLLNLSNSLIADYKNRPFKEKAIANLPVSVSEIDQKRGSKFVEQLEVINVDDEEIIEAINDYLRASAEKVRYANEGNVTKTDFEVFYDALVEHWKSIFRLQKREGTGSPENIGYKTMNLTLRNREKLKGVETEQSYTTKGAYHRLANELNVGWHPDWKKIIKK